MIFVKCDEITWFVCISPANGSHVSAIDNLFRHSSIRKRRPLISPPTIEPMSVPYSRSVSFYCHLFVLAALFGLFVRVVNSSPPQ
ncbi:hypothetical protein BDZ85DRAFT_270219 [Elsinoe ampelina]|uniref:Uncharacterized protein n=1 Tax=Elsinoe ampelina TaxID=302913 RepID=A0A6A6FYT4_9PEZI|nr:hypothetical protein BDZ85DRAFT_270219 [Elsinoe ampelina]